MERPMNTAARDRVYYKAVNEYIRSTEKRHTPVSRVKLVRNKEGGVEVIVHTSRPAIVRMDAADMAGAIKEELHPERDVTVSVVAESRAVAKFVRTSPRKARLVLNELKGKRVSEALALLQFIPNIVSEVLTKVLKSAAANAQDGWGAIPEELKIANFIADGGPSLKRVRPRAQGRAYRILKRTSHLTVILTEMPAAKPKRRPQGKPKTKAVAPKPAPAKKIGEAPVVAEPIEQTVMPIAQEPQIEMTTVPQEATPVSESDAPESEGSATSNLQAEVNEGVTAEPNQE